MSDDNDYPAPPTIQPVFEPDSPPRMLHMTSGKKGFDVLEPVPMIERVSDKIAPPSPPSKE